MKKRVGIIALLQEGNTFLDQPTELSDFESNLLCSKQHVIEAFRGAQHEVGGFIEGIEAEPDLELVGIFAARAMPYGTVTADCWNTLVSRLLQELREAGPLDGILVAPHGATVAQNAPDADGDWLSRVRQQVGDQLPIIGTLDLHANVSPLMAQSCQALLGYRSNPHLDQQARGREASRYMVQTLKGEIEIHQTLVQLPFCVNIERQATYEPHGKKLWDEANRLAREIPNVLNVSCLYGFPYADVAEMGASVLAVVDGTSAFAEKTARQMADFWWGMRQEFVGQMISVPTAIELALQIYQENPGRPVGLLDMGDNVGGGSAGDGTFIPHEWLKSGAGALLTVLYDQESVRIAEEAKVGNRVRLSIGGKSDRRHGAPLELNFEVLGLTSGKFDEPEARHGGYNHFDQGRTAILRSDEGVTVMATSRRVAPLSLHQILHAGLQPNDYVAIVIKGVHAPVAAYAPVCSRLLRVNTPGATCADLDQFTFHHRRRPMFPFERL